MRARVINNNDVILDNITVPEEDMVMEHFTVVDNNRYIDPNQSGSFNGVYCRYNKLRHRLARPFLDELKKLCQDSGLPLVVEDERQPWLYEMLSENDIGQDFLPGITLEQYQIDGIRVALRREQGIYYWGCGSGKSELAAGICKAIRCPTIILADQRIIIDQLKQRLELRDVIDEVGLFYAGHTPQGQLIVIGSVQSLQIPTSVPQKPQESDAYIRAKERVLSNADGVDEAIVNQEISNLADEIYTKMLAKYEASLKGFRSRKQRAEQFQELVKKAEMLIVDECVHEDSFITTNHGLIRAGDLHNMIQGGQIIMAAVDNKYYQITNSSSKSDLTAKIVTSTRRELRTSLNHKCAILTSDLKISYKYTSDLKSDDLMLVQRSQRRPININKRWYYLGLFIGDGHLLNGVQVKFGVRKDIDDWAEATREMASEWDGFCVASVNCRGDSVFRVKSIGLCQWLNSLGFSKGRKMGSIDPKFSVPGPTEAASLLRGLFDTEGSSYYNVANFDSTDRPLALFCQQLLSYLGIGSTVIMSNKRNNEKHKMLWRTLVCGQNFTKFQELVGFGFKRKYRDKYYNTIDSDRLINVRPWVDKLLLSGITRSKLKLQFGRLFSSVLYQGSCISYSKLLDWVGKVRLLANMPIETYSDARCIFGISDSKAASRIGIRSHIAYTRRKAGDDSIWRALLSDMQSNMKLIIDLDLPHNYAVESVQSINFDNQVGKLIDFTVQSVNCFEANGLLVHNCDLCSTSTQWKLVFRDLFKGRRKYGLSGTIDDPSRPVENLFVKEHLGSVLTYVGRHELERLGRVIPIEYTMFALGDSPSEGSTYDIAVREKMVENVDFHKLIAAICGQYKNEKTLILVERDMLGEALQLMIPGSSFIHGATVKSRRTQVLASFENEETRVLIGGKIIRRGLDLKGGCDNLIIATGGKLWSTLIQQLSRAVRVNKRGFGRVFDFLFLYNKYLYSHSRTRLRTIVNVGYKTKVVFSDGQQISGDKFVASKFRRPKPKHVIG